MVCNCFTWLDPPVLTSSASMEGKKMAPPPHQHPPRPHQPHPQSNHAENHYTDSPQYTQVMQQPQQHPSSVIHQAPTRPQHPQSIGPRSPLLENHQDLYGTRQPTELARQYALREQQQMANQRLEQQQRSMPMGNSSYSLQSPSQDPILTAPVPPGYNASVHQAYLRRNQHQLGDHQQIYQNHQSIYQPANQQSRMYQPYTSRIQQPNYMSPGHSHTQLLRQQYNELQQMKLQQQMQYQSQAQIQQQQTFAQRQILHQHLHSRQQSQQNLAQYSISPSTAQLNEVNARLSKKQDNMITPDDYATHQSMKNNQNQAKQSSVSPISKTSGDPMSSPSTKSPSGSESRRSSSGTSQALRSPIAQRPPSAPVTKAGWLYKQGSDGLKVWRKRWFVLSEYCLFYYKGQEEDKLLGSVLLPSYVVSLCTGDEKGLRKWSFKCEHANMRTYVLAAPDQHSMEQWVRVLTMAATMQDIRSMEKQHQSGQSAQLKERRSKTPIHSGEQDEIVPETSATVQHMYENAPPKPRRSNEGYQSPSPERADRYDPNYDILREPAYGSAESSQQKFVKNRMNAKSPIHTNAEAIYESKSASSNYATQRNLTKSPEAVYNAHNLSLPLTNTHTNRLDNNKSPMTISNNMPNRLTQSNENRMSQNKSPAYFDNKNLPQEVVQAQNYQHENQNIYVESGYQKMLQQQDMNKRMMEREIYQEQSAMQGQLQNMNRTNANGSFVERQSFERRTPDTYGRSMIVPGYYSKGRSGDYEDVYNNPSNSQNYREHSRDQSREQSYRRPISPVAYEDKSTTPVQLPHQRYAQTNLDSNQIYQAPPVQMRQKKLPHNYTAPVLPHNSVPRPHSADFLEYEAKNASYDTNISTRHTNPSRQPPRPKSSLDINSHDYNGDNYYYSEASYAEKMRQSAHYLRNKNFGSTVFNPRQSDPKSPEYVKERKMSMPSFRGDESIYDPEMRIDRESIYGMRDQNRNVNGSDKYRHSEVTGPNSNWTLRNKSLSQIMTQDDVYNRSNSAMSEGSTVSGFNRDATQMSIGNGDQFMRSASARLPSTGSEQLSSRDGERKVQQVGVREESMKRLLEWKQRMLQSPLTRKPTPATLSLARSLPPGPSQRQTLPKVSNRLHNQIQPSYNSYSSDDEASMSASISGMESSMGKRQPLVGGSSASRAAQIPVRAVSPRVRPSGDQGGWSGNDSDSLWTSQTICQPMNTEENWSNSRSPSRQGNNQPIRAVSPRVRRASDLDERAPPPPPPPAPLQPLPPSPPPPESPADLGQSPGGSVPDLSAGELLGRTHEELVLLLIQLRRRHSATASAIEQCCTQIHSVQSRLSTDESSEHRHENLQRLEHLRRHLSDLERHYTKSKPLVHLVDNMVKLGALYNRGPTTIDRLEQNQLLRERQLLEQAQEQRRWAQSSESLSREQVEQRVEQLRAMERSVAGEAQTLRGLRREREALQRALGGAHLQQDLSRVHAMLAINSKKLEQTVAGNARLEQELAVLRQKLQGQHMNYTNKDTVPSNDAGTDARTAADATALLEDELKRVQHLVGDLQKQRQELSVAVRQLTDKSQSLGLVSSNSNIHAASTDYSGDPSSFADSQAKKRFNPPWVETDLDNEALEHGSSSPTGLSMAPLYIDTHSTDQRPPSPDQNDDLALNSAFANLSSVEKQEIKTVRIVKRESERRQRDRERSSLQPGNSEWTSHQTVGTLDQLLEEDNMAQYSSRSTSLPRGFQPAPPQYSYNTNTSYQQDNQSNSRQYAYQQDNTSSYQHRLHANPPNTLSLTNVNNPFDNMSTSSVSINNKFVSNPSLINNNDYTSNHQDVIQMSHTKYGGYQKSAQILPLPVSSNNYTSSLPKHTVSHSAPYMDSNLSEITRSVYTNGPISPGLSKAASINSLTKANAELSPVFTSEAARQIIIEMAGEKNGVVKSNGSQHRRQVPKEKRRHYTAPHHLSAKALDQANGDDFFYQEKWYRARDDVDMERVLRGSSHGPPPLAAPPDVVRSTLPAPHTDHYSEHTIDRLLAAPNKILIPERYIPEQAPELSPEEQKKRMEKVESIKKMLSSTTPSGDPSKSPDDNDKRQREHLLQLNQILAKQVMEMSKIVAGTGADSLQPMPSPNPMNQKP